MPAAVPAAVPERPELRHRRLRLPARLAPSRLPARLVPRAAAGVLRVASPSCGALRSLASSVRRERRWVWPRTEEAGTSTVRRLRRSFASPAPLGCHRRLHLMRSIHICSNIATPRSTTVVSSTDVKYRSPIIPSSASVITSARCQHHRSQTVFIRWSLTEISGSPRVIAHEMLLHNMRSDVYQC